MSGAGADPELILTNDKGEEIDATFGYRSVANRGVMSPSIIGTTITLLDKVGKMAVDIYEGKKG